ncbi:bifunctional diaminohydroxyphosphoribosylaminopyrimidine deaminase/5-amino-6-(5-phosphoribosylamino)uracil reductase RibD [Flavihumibacter sp. R14]|nr:bifunctional diaminohydroxyphosphoribosylaminopyrimidine deaminase/5-amino-6-(5-phosphoribosylamino)uracil reductase RibD [Flavihumibacter soli]
MPNHETFMRRCIELALNGTRSVNPNPMVGSVIVKDGKIIGEGYHQTYGAPHAEANAITSVLSNYPDGEKLLEKSTLYVNLEPCAHFGKRPPCSDLIIRYKIPKVVVGCRDPFPLVNGKGIEKLKDAGVQIIEDVLTAECLQVNRRFITRVKKQRPYIILKWAQTADGYFAPANGDQKWISSAMSRRLVHKWRSEEDAVLVGYNTAKADNPQLNTRLWETNSKSPVRIVIDRKLQLDHSLHLFDQAQPTIVFNSLKTYVDHKIKYLELEDFDHYLPQLICYQLYLMDFQSIIIEGGLKTLELFINAGLWDESRVFIADENWGEGMPAPILPGKADHIETVDTDILEIRYNL